MSTCRECYLTVCCKFLPTYIYNIFIESYVCKDICIIAVPYVCVYSCATKAEIRNDGVESTIIVMWLLMHVCIHKYIYAYINKCKVKLINKLKTKSVLFNCPQSF